jgi:hypothetical protein
MALRTSELRGAIALLVSSGAMPVETAGLDVLARSARLPAAARAAVHDGWPLLVDAAVAVRAVTRIPWLTDELARTVQIARAALDAAPDDAALERLERRAAATYWGSRLSSVTDAPGHERAWSQLFRDVPWDVRVSYERALAEPLHRPDDARAVSHAVAALRHAWTGQLAFHARRGTTPMASRAAATAATLAAIGAGPALWADLVAHAISRLDRAQTAAHPAMPAP